MGGRTFIQARLATTIGAAFIATLIGAALFGWPAIAQDDRVSIFAYSSQEPAEHAVRRSRATSRHTLARRASVHKKSKTAKYDETKKSAPQGAVYAIVSLADQRVTVYDSTGRIARSQISSGIPGHPTPIGLFSIIGKERWHRSNIYSGAPMPFMQRITWSGVAMHLGVVPGHPASHGCIRLPDGFAQQFWGMTQIGSRVVIARHDAMPVPITSTALPAPKMRPAPEITSAVQSSPTPLKLASMRETSPGSDAAAQAPGTTTAKLLNPIEYAKVLRERATASKAAAERAAKGALSMAQTAGAKARQAMDAVAKRQAALNAAEAKLVAVGKATGPGTDSSAEAASSRTISQADVEHERAALADAQGQQADASQAAFSAVQTWKEAVAAAERAAGSVGEAERRLKPVSVLFSKKEGRVFIRQDWKEVYQAPIAFKDPDRPIGTHLFIAVNADVDGQLTWSAISVPSGGTSKNDLAPKGSKAPKRANPAPPPNVQGDTASAALERIEMSDDVRERIAELVWVGAQVIVTDNARSDEMDSDSDIIVSTR